MTFSTIFDLAMDLMLQRASSGVIPTASVADYRAAAPGIFTLLQAQIGSTGGFPFVLVGTLEDEMILPDSCALPLAHGLSAKLLADENPGLAAHFQMVYEETRRLPSRPQKIRDVYTM